MKPISFILILLIIVVNQSFSNNWRYIEDFAFGDKPQGVVVTPDDRIWLGFDGVTDSINVGGGIFLPTRPLWIYNADGSLHQKIQFLRLREGACL